MASGARRARAVHQRTGGVSVAPWSPAIWRPCRRYADAVAAIAAGCAQPPSCRPSRAGSAGAWHRRGRSGCSRQRLPGRPMPPSAHARHGLRGADGRLPAGAAGSQRWFRRGRGACRLARTCRRRDRSHRAAPARKLPRRMRSCWPGWGRRSAPRISKWAMKCAPRSWPRDAARRSGLHAQRATAAGSATSTRWRASGLRHWDHAYQRRRTVHLCRRAPLLLAPPRCAASRPCQAPVEWPPSYGVRHEHTRPGSSASRCWAASPACCWPACSCWCPSSARARALPFMVAFATGALLGAALLGLLPEAIELAGPGNYGKVGLSLLGGIALFFVLEKLVLWRHCHEDTARRMLAEHDRRHAPRQQCAGRDDHHRRHHAQRARRRADRRRVPDRCQPGHHDRASPCWRTRCPAKWAISPCCCTVA